MEGISKTYRMQYGQSPLGPFISLLRCLLRHPGMGQGGVEGAAARGPRPRHLWLGQDTGLGEVGLQELLQHPRTPRALRVQDHDDPGPLPNHQGMAGSFKLGRWHDLPGRGRRIVQQRRS